VPTEENLVFSVERQVGERINKTAIGLHLKDSSGDAYLDIVC
jgi:hypothetical protein